MNPSFLPRFLRHPYERFALLLGLGGLGAGCLVWTALAFPLSLVLRGPCGVQVGRRVAEYGFRFYLWSLHWIGVARFDLRELDQLRNAGAMIIAPNHPGLLDALMIISRLPDVACVLKASLLDNPLWGAGSRLAGYIRNDWFVGSINLAVEELRRGGSLLLFPEGTRTEAPPQLNPFRAGVAYVAHRAGVPIQAVIIETDSAFLGKGWPILRRPDMPMHFRVRLGRRFEAPEDPVAATRELEDYFAREMQGPGGERQA